MERARKILVAGVLSVSILCSSARLAATAAEDNMYGGGSGTAADPYLIYTSQQMNAIGENPYDWDKDFKLMADIDLGDFGGSDFNIIGSPGKPFTGTFDGNGKIISNLCLTNRDRLMGLFSWICGGEIKNLGLINPHIERGWRHTAGALVGLINGGSVRRCYVSGGSVTACCDSDSIGGLVGYIMDGTVSECYSSATVSGAMAFVGGLVGYLQDGAISNCCSIGSASGGQQVGGLIGSIKYGTVINCYSAGRVEAGVYAGGLAGYNHEGTVRDCFWDRATSGQTGSASGSPKTTAEMMRQATFVNWDFVDVWDIIEDESYPFLRAFVPVVEVAVDIKPGSCPNPLNPASRGVLALAILGTEEFDVSAIDATSVELEGVGAVRSSFEDISAPASGSEECDCGEQGPDGYMDLTLKFKVQDLTQALAVTAADLVEDEVLTLNVTGVLTDETGIEGADCVIVVGQVPRSTVARRWDANGDGIVDMFDFGLMAQNWLETTIVE